METIKSYILNDTLVMLGRSMRHHFRSVDTIITATIMPVALMLLFVYVLGGAIKSGSDNYVNYLLPGVLLMAIANSMGYTSFRLYNDVRLGIFDRFHSMPIPHSAAIWGHVLVSLVSNAVSVIVIIMVAFIMGFRSPAGITAWLAVTGILALFTLALTWVAAIPGLTAKTQDGALAVAYPIHLLPLISSAFVPTDTMPRAVRVFAENQPVTSIVNAMRSLLNDQPVGNDLRSALIWCVVILLIAYFITMRLYRKRI
jgi:ABC-2 type transport system permease protein